MTTSAMQRSRDQSPYYTRSKVIAVSECVGLHYIHFVQEFLPISGCKDLQSLHVDPTIGMLHHYRFAVPAGTDNSVLDDDYMPKLFETELCDAVSFVRNQVLLMAA